MTLARQIPPGPQKQAPSMFFITLLPTAIAPPPAVLGGINVKFWHAHQAHLLVVGVALDPTHPMSPGEAAQPNNAGAQPEIDGAWPNGHKNKTNKAIVAIVAIGHRKSQMCRRMKLPLVKFGEAPSEKAFIFIPDISDLRKAVSWTPHKHLKKETRCQIVRSLQQLPSSGP